MSIAGRHRRHVRSTNSHMGGSRLGRLAGGAIGESARWIPMAVLACAATMGLGVTVAAGPAGADPLPPAQRGGASAPTSGQRGASVPARGGSGSAPVAGTPAANKAPAIGAVPVIPRSPGSQLGGGIGDRSIAECTENDTFVRNGKTILNRHSYVPSVDGSTPRCPESGTRLDLNRIINGY